MSPAPELFDTHSHLDVGSFDYDRDQVIANAIRNGVTRQLVPAINEDNWQAIRTLCHSTQGLYPAYGFHPMYLPSKGYSTLRR